MLLTGVDAGGTKTAAATFTCEGDLIGVGNSGPGNYHNVGIETAVSNIQDSIFTSTKGRRPDILVIGVAGLDTQRDYDTLAPHVGNLGKRVFLEHDGFSALIGEIGNGAGVLVIAGTGSIVVGVDSHGNRHRRGDWGWLLGDEGSAYQIGLQGLRTVVKMLDGRLRRGILADEVLKSVNVADLAGLAEWTYNRPHTVERIAALASAVDSAASKGDQLADMIVQSSARELATIASDLTRVVGVKQVYGKGGVFNSPRYTNHFSQKLREEQISFVKVQGPPYRGEVLIAFREANCKPPSLQ